MKQYKVGDKVRIVCNIKEKDHFPGVTPEMVSMAGREVTIARAPDPGTSGYYKIKEDAGWNWDDDWFEDTYPEPEEVKESEILSLFAR